MRHAANSQEALCFSLSARVVSLMAVALFVLASAAFAGPKSALGELVQGKPTQIANSRAFLADPEGIGAIGHGLL